MGKVTIGKLSYSNNDIPQTVRYVQYIEAQRIMRELIASHSLKLVHDTPEHQYYFAPTISIDTWEGVISITRHDENGIHHTVGYDVDISPELREWHQLICLGVPAGWL